MKHLKHIILLAIMTLTLSSCQNNGDIGVLYGLWAVDEVTIDGDKDTDFPYGTVYMRFQGDHLVYSQTAEHHETARAYTGTWSRTDTTITLDFDHHTATDRPSGNIPPMLVIPAQTATTCTIIKETSRAFIFRFTDDKDRIVQFTLRKII